MGGLEVVTFGNVDLSHLEAGRHDRHVACGGLVIIDDYVGKAMTTACCEKIQVLENTVKLLRCEEAHLANKCSRYCSESSGVFK